VSYEQQGDKTNSDLVDDQALYRAEYQGLYLRPLLNFVSRYYSDIEDTTLQENSVEIDSL
jgi:hypothetical protein